MRNALERTLPTLTVLLAVLVSGCAVPSAAEQVPAAPPSFKDASVHDPSVIKVGDTFYVFGSHLAAAKTTDFMQWDLVADGVNPDNPLFDNVVDRAAGDLRLGANGLRCGQRM